MKTISLYQPWASLVVLGHKTWETRSWSTSYRGRLAIHASKKFTQTQRELCLKWPFSKYITQNPDTMPRGFVLGSVDLMDCIRTEGWMARHQLFETEHVQEEFRFGDYSPGRFAWELCNPIVFKEPIPAKGSLGIWEFPESALGHLAQESP